MAVHQPVDGVGARGSGDQRLGDGRSHVRPKAGEQHQNGHEEEPAAHTAGVGQPGYDKDERKGDTVAPGEWREAFVHATVRAEIAPELNVGALGVIATGQEEESISAVSEEHARGKVPCPLRWRGEGRRECLTRETHAEAAKRIFGAEALRPTNLGRR
eukprot:ctg_709.g196